jgi:hypothetical protein
MGASFRIARAMEIRWRSPPESFIPVRRSGVVPLGKPHDEVMGVGPRAARTMSSCEACWFP